ncbi:MAG: MIP/aquaporin family protein [Propionibacteriaceae bacterium]|nr:MIP/aquaporin family protein [Propionibacteriaceae bacterium]
MGTIFLSETVGSMLLLLLGCGVVANTALAKTKGNGTGFLFVNWGWGIAVFVGVLASYKSGGHLNPAVTFGLLTSGATEMGGLPVSPGLIATYLGGQLLGAMLGALLAWVAYKQHFDEEPDPATKLGVFATGPAIRNPLFNLLTEIIGTFVLVFGVLAAGKFTAAAGTDAVNLGWLGALGVALLVFGIGASLGGPTGYAINPTRDLGPRIMHAVLPIKGKGDSDWSYAWVPVVGPIIGGVVAGLLAGPLLP